MEREIACGVRTHLSSGSAAVSAISANLMNSSASTCRHGRDDVVEMERTTPRQKADQLPNFVFLD